MKINYLIILLIFNGLPDKLEETQDLTSMVSGKQALWQLLKPARVLPPGD
jgi:hypothetical protein